LEFPLLLFQYFSLIHYAIRNLEDYVKKEKLLQHVSNKVLFIQGLF